MALNPSNSSNFEHLALKGLNRLAGYVDYNYVLLSSTRLLHEYVV